MTPTLIALAGFAGWTLLITFLLLNMRGYHSFMGNKVPLNKFNPDGSDVEGFGQRLTRVHLNCTEMLPSFAAVTLVAFASNQLAIMDPTAMYILYARIAQSTVHIVSTNMVAVLLRATFWLIQLLLLLYYAYQLLAPVFA